MLEQLITTVLTYLNAAGYYKSAEEIQNAINVAQLDLYKRLRGNMAQYAPGRPFASVNPEQTTVSTDAVVELLVQADMSNGAVTVDPSTETSTLVRINTNFYGKTIDIMLSLELLYPAQSVFYPVNIVPDNQFLMLKNNPVVPPVETRPIGRIFGLDGASLIYEITPFKPVIDNALSVRAKCITIPNSVAFTFTDIGGPIPQINVITPMVWTSDKLDNLVYGTVANLGFNLSNGVLVQSGNSMNEKIL